MKNKEVASYLSKIDQPKKDMAVDLINNIQNFAPNAEIYMSYGMPCFKYKGRYLIGVGAFKNHVSIFPGGEITTLFSKELVGYKTQKGTIQIPIGKKFPEELLEKIIHHITKRIDNN